MKATEPSWELGIKLKQRNSFTEGKRRGFYARAQIRWAWLAGMTAESIKSRHDRVRNAHVTMLIGGGEKVWTRREG